MYKVVICDISNLSGRERSCIGVEVLYAIEVKLVQFKLYCYNFRMLYVIAMITTKKKRIEKRIKMWYYKKKKKIQPNTNENNSRGNEGKKAIQYTENKQNNKSKSLSVITLKINGLNSLTKRHQLAAWIFFQWSKYIQSIRDSLQI